MNANIKLILNSTKQFKKYISNFKGHFSGSYPHSPDGNAIDIFALKGWPGPITTPFTRLVFTIMHHPVHSIWLSYHTISWCDIVREPSKHFRPGFAYFTYALPIYAYMRMAQFQNSQHTCEIVWNQIMFIFDFLVMNIFEIKIIRLNHLICLICYVVHFHVKVKRYVLFSTNVIV